MATGTPPRTSAPAPVATTGKAPRRKAGAKTEGKVAAEEKAAPAKAPGPRKSPRRKAAAAPSAAEAPPVRTEPAKPAARPAALPPCAAPGEDVVASLAEGAQQLWMLNPLHKILPLNWSAITESLMTLAGHASTEPDRTKERLSELSMRIWQETSTIWSDWMSIWLGKPLSAPPAPQPERSNADPRFDTPEWRQNPVFRQLAKSYEALSDYLLAEAGRSELPAEERRRLGFHVRQLVDATSPTLFLATNPAAIKKAFETGGGSIAEGWRNLLADIQSGKLSMTDVDAYKPGRNLATTPGKVVFRNRLIELLQYAPTTPQVHQTPVLFIPPWINKYYILDLQPGNSMVRYLLDQGHTVFMISWKNPDASMEEMSFEDYIIEGPLAASDAIREITGQPRLNAVGYCIGGTLLATTLAILAAKGDDRFNAVTFMVSLQDFSEVGDSAVFFDDDSIAYIENQMMERGYLDSRHMTDMFSLLRANDLIWSTVVNNYLLGNKPPAFDLLYWNADGTRMARAAHSFYLHQTYIENALIRPGAVTLLGEPVDLGRIGQDIYAVGAEKDHIVPWRGAWRITRLAGGKVRFVLAASGHIAGMINPPAKSKGSHWINDEAAPDPETWLKGAEKRDGSWWADWAAWLAPRSGALVAAPPLGSRAHPPLADAPGTYVLER